MKFDLQVYPKSFADLLRAYSKLEVPAFQRPYSWEPKHWAQLWEDITTRLEADYLIGNLVICGGDESAELVIDGQQRLSTITVLLAACRDYLWQEIGSDKAKEIARGIHNDYIVSGGVVDDRAEPYLTLGEVDKSWFKKRIQVGPSEEGFDPPGIGKVPYKQPGSNRLLWRSYQYFYRQLQRRHATKGGVPNDAKIDDVKAIARQLAKRTWFVVTRVPDDSQAFTLFEVLNDRGLELSISDLIKNVVLSHANKVGRYDRVKSIWSEIADSLDYQNISPFLRYYWMSTNGKKITENDLFKKIKDEIKKKSAPELVSFLKSLSDEADNYAQLIGRAETKSPLSDQLGLLRSYGFRVVNSLLLAVWKTMPEDRARENAVRTLKNFLVQYATFANQVTNELEGLLAEFSLSLRKNGAREFETITRKLSRKLPAEQTIWDGFLELEPSAQVARAILSEIEGEISGVEKKVAGTETVHIEHIFPQSADDDWLDAFDADGAEESFLARLGNLTLLSAKLNKQASNKPFGKKVGDFYAKSDFKITNTLKKYSDWNTKAVIARQKELQGFAKKIWALK